ncbi:MAG: rod shape-determining protein MreC [Egibacteraceae bacterium]
MRSRSALVILVLVSVGLMTLGYRQGPRGPLSQVERGATTVVAPVQEGFAALVRPIGGLLTSIGQLGRLRAENQQLRTDLKQLDQRRISLMEVERENDRLRALLDFQKRYQLVTTGAQVIAPTPGALEWRVLVDVGAAEGVKTGMAVVNAQGLIGRVVEVTAKYSWVELATSPSAGYAVRIAQNGEIGALTGRGPEPYQLEVYDTEAQLPKDAEIVTQSYQGSRIPDGIPVGRVSSPPGGLAQGTRFVEVRPYVDFTALGAVLVVLNAPSRPEEFEPGEVIIDPDPPRPPPPGVRETRPSEQALTGSGDRSGEPTGADARESETGSGG